jgi:hypothetical protein
MTAKEPMEIYAVPEIFVDGFTQHMSRDGVMSCIGYRKMAEGSIVVIRLVWPATSTGAAIDEANEALAMKIGVH